MNALMVNGVAHRLLNSILVAGVTVGGCLLVSITASFALARIRFRGRQGLLIASHILQGVGFKENIESLTYCATRLRFNLKDDHLIDDVLVHRLGVVKNTFRTRGQYHVVIGLEYTKEIYEQVKSLLENDVIHTREFDIANRIL